MYFAGKNEEKKRYRLCRTPVSCIFITKTQKEAEQ